MINRPEREGRIQTPPGNRVPTVLRASALICASVCMGLAGGLPARSVEQTGHTFLTAGQLLDMCLFEGHTPANPGPAAMLYLMGIADAEGIASSRSVVPLFCVPDGTGQATLGTVVCSYVDRHPGNRGYTAASFAYAALREAFPCK